MQEFCWLIITVVIYIFICILHELGHYFSLKINGIDANLSFNIQYFRASFDEDMLKTKSKQMQIFVYCSGVLVSFISVFLLIIIFNQMWFRIFLCMFFIIEVLIQLFKKEGDLRKTIKAISQ